MKDPRFLSRHSIKVNVPLAGQTAIDVGGNADFFAEVSDPKKMAKLLTDAAANDLKTIVLGAGTASVFSDHGVRGLVVRNAYHAIDISTDRVRVGSGCRVSDLVHHLAEESCGGLESFVGHAGSVGSAVRQNLRVGSALLSEQVISATVYSRGSVVSVGPADLGFGLDDSRFLRSGETIIDVTLKTHKRPADDIKKAILTTTQARLRHQPGARRAIRVFRDPAGHTATELATQVGMAGERVGGAVISGKDPNYVINEGDAKAAEVYELAQRIKHRVSLRLGKKLVENVSWLGEW